MAMDIPGEPAHEDWMVEVAELRDPRADGRRCTLCGGETFRLLHHWDPDHPRNVSTAAPGYWQCACGLAFLHPVPGPDQLPDHGEWWSSRRKLIIRRRRFKRLRARVQNWLFGTPVDRLIRQVRRVQPAGRLLDIGCGRGEPLAPAARQYQCDGMEPSPVAAKEARRRGFRVLETTFESASIPSASYDVAVLDSVLEHLPDPVYVLRQVNRILKPEGVVVKLPKLWGPSHRRHRREWNGFRVGCHLTMFSGRTLDAALEAAGFTPLRRPRRDRPLDDILVVWGRKAPLRHRGSCGPPGRVRRGLRAHKGLANTACQRRFDGPPLLEARIGGYHGTLGGGS
ncbi:MAG TPA: class I SAM-dependent methyltransferase [Planctomycetes bacterium]|nr:class I SAM-dependent methyltransferase [Planctomycetota bacterium]